MTGSCACLCTRWQARVSKASRGPAEVLVGSATRERERTRDSPMSAIWYALHSKPRKEAALERQARAEGFEGYLPLLRVKPVNPRSRQWVPYFPGYLFVHTDLPVVGASRFNWMPYAQGLVS